MENLIDEESDKKEINEELLKELKELR